MNNAQTTKFAVRLICVGAGTIVVIGILSVLLRNTPYLSAVAFLGAVILLILLVYVVIYFKEMFKEWFK
jgi:hypothetical protein